MAMMPMMSGPGGSGGTKGSGSAAMAAAVLSGASLFLVGALSGYLLHSSCGARTEGAGADTTRRDGEESGPTDVGGDPNAPEASSSSSDGNHEGKGDGRPPGRSSTDATTVDGASAVAGGGRGGKDNSGGKVKKPGKGGDDGGGGGPSRPIVMVVQRCRHARLLLHASGGIDNATDGELSGGGESPKKESIATVGRRVDIGSPLPSLPSPSSSEHGDAGDEIPVPILPVGGMVVYVSFARTAKSGHMVTDAARTLLNLPILTRGRWGDGGGGGSTVMSALRMAAELDSERKMSGGGRGDAAVTRDEGTPSPGRTPTDKEEEGVAIVVVPQANLISKVKSGGKSVQYHDQIDKGTGAKLFDEFVDALTHLSLQHQLATRGDGEGDAGHDRSIPAKTAEGQQSAMAASIPPELAFRDESKYSSWDDDGFPLTDVDGKPLTKSARKKLRRIHDAQRKRHAKYLLEQQQQQQQQRAGKGDDDDGVPVEPDPPGAPGDEGAKEPGQQLDPGFITIVRGAFGRRQGLEFCSDMGPFCHVLGVG